MFRWGKKADGFEWHKYVRTTIKLRREQRREQAHAAKDAVVAQGKAAGVAFAALGTSAAGLALAGSRSLAANLRVQLTAFARMAFDRTARLAAWTARFIADHNLAALLAFAGGVLMAYSISRLHQGQRDVLTIAAFGVSTLVLLAAARSWLAGGSSTAVRILARAGRLDRRYAAAGMAALAVVGVGALAATRGVPDMMALVPRMPALPFGGGKALEGRATVLGGDTLRIADTVVQLAGIEAPDREQRCTRPGSIKWRCGEAATEGLQRLARGRTLRCELSGSSASGQPLAVCKDGGTDIAAQLVREGLVFAATGIFSSYGAQEREALNAKAGLWRGPVERPAEFRAKAWEAAKAKAPDGCPIKGRVTASGRVYLLPWSSDYAAARVQKAKGERWFCSENEAQGAGWKAATRS